MSDMLYCHSCKIDPSEVAHFDLTLPESSTERPNADLVFSGDIEMSFTHGDSILEAAVDVFPVLVVMLQLMRTHFKSNDFRDTE